MPRESGSGESGSGEPVVCAGGKLPQVMRTRPFTSVFTIVAVAVAAVPLAAMELTPRDIQRADTYCQLGLKSLNSGDTEKAKMRYTQALESAPSFPDALLGLGHVDMKKAR